MRPQAHVQPALGKHGSASSDDSDLNQLAQQTLASVPANLLPLEPFPIGFDLGALASSRSSRPPAAVDPAQDADARLDLRAAAPSVAPERSSAAPHAFSGTAPALRGGASLSGTAPALRGGASLSGTAPALRGGASLSGTAPALRGGASLSGTAPALRGGASLSGTAPALRGGASLPPPKRTRVVDLAPHAPSTQSSCAPPRVLPPPKRTRVVDLAAPAASLRSFDDELGALVASRTFALSTAWRVHAPRFLAAAERAPRWSWAVAGAAAVAFAWLISGSHRDAAPAPAVTAASSSGSAPALRGGASMSGSAPALRGGASIASAADAIPATSVASLAAIAFPHPAQAVPGADARVESKRARSARSSAVTTAPVATAAREPAPASQAQPQPQSREERTMDTLLDQALPTGSAADPSLAEPAPRAKMDSALPALPPRAAVAGVLGGLLPRVRFCAGDHSGVATAHVIVSKDGRVTSARVTGALFSSTAAGRCMESVIRGARFPAFAEPTFRVTYPFQL